MKAGKSTKLFTHPLKTVPRLVDHTRLKPYHADPIVVALARVMMAREQLSLFPREVAVLTHEKKDQSPKRIPHACNCLGVKCLTLVDLFDREGWSF